MQRNTKKYREIQRNTEKYREIQRNADMQRYSHVLHDLYDPHEKLTHVGSYRNLKNLVEF